MKLLTVEEIARLVGGQTRGDHTLEITGAAPLTQAKSTDLTFVSGDRNVNLLAKSRAGACLIRDTDLPTALALNLDTAWIVVADPQDAFQTVMPQFRPIRPRSKIGISPSAWVSPTAVIGSDTNIYPGAFVDEGVVIGAGCDIFPGVVIGRDCRIGDGCTLYPSAVLYADVTLGKRVILHAGCVLGADGFGYRFANGRFEKIPQMGCVQVDDDCEIGACSTVDRGAVGATTLGTGTKIDNLVQIGHNCQLGRHNLFVSQVGLAGSVTSGDFVRCAGQVGVADHVHLGTGSTYGAKAGVHRDMPAGQTYIGAPAGPEKEQMRAVLSITRIPAMRDEIRQLQKQLEALTQRLGEDVQKRVA